MNRVEEPPVQVVSVPNQRFNLVFRPYQSSYYPGYSSLSEDLLRTSRHTNSILKLVNITRSINGYGNNLANPTYGMSNTRLARATPALYKDFRSTPMDSHYNPRVTSNQLGRVKYPLALDPHNVTEAFTIWGQFVDHDLSLTEVD